MPLSEAGRAGVPACIAAAALFLLLATVSAQPLPLEAHTHGKHSIADDLNDSRTKFYMITAQQAEADQPWLRRCGLTTWAAQAYQALLSSPRRTLEPSQASLYVFPPYTDWETNWPAYGAGFSGANVARQGRPCITTDGDIIEAALAARERLLSNASSHAPAVPATRHLSAAAAVQAAPQPRVLLMDSWPWYPKPYSSLMRYYSDSRLAWAKLAALQQYHRTGTDVSLPPPVHDGRQFLPYITKLLGGLPAGQLGSAEQQEAAGGSAAQFLLVFKGSFRTNPRWRGRLRQLHDPSQGVVIIDTSVPSSSSSKDSSSGSGAGYDYAQLMARSLFAAVPPGDVPFSYRFSEAVCSGSVPVLLSDGWVPPLDATVPFHTYGLRFSQADIGPQMLASLRAVPLEEHARLRAEALRVCHRYLETVGQAAEAIVSEALDGGCSGSSSGGVAAP